MPDVSILSVPEGAETLAQLELITDADGTRVSLDAVGGAGDAGAGSYPTALDEHPTRGVTSDGGSARDLDLDVPDRAARLLDVLQAHGEPVTKREAETLGAEADPDLDVSYRTVSEWINALDEAGALVEAGRTDSNAVKYRIPIPSVD